MKETQQQVQSIQNILVGENVPVFLSVVRDSSGEEEGSQGFPGVTSISPWSGLHLDPCSATPGSGAS